MKLRMFIAASAAGALVAVPSLATAQTDPVQGGTGIQATVPSALELILAQPKATLSSFKKAKSYSTSFDVQVITTENSAQLSVVDGDVASGSKVGRLAAGKKLLPLPLEARVGKKSFTKLNTPVTPLLATWNQPVSRAKATVNLRQQVKTKVKGSYRKVLLVTLSNATP
jgi:hypothetical protein